jgi:RNA polymerase sigma-70 factor (ECF subfamily)
VRLAVYFGEAPEEVSLDSEREILAFLAGEPEPLTRARRAIEQTVRSFSAADDESRKDLAQEAMVRLCASLRSGRFRRAASLHTYATSVARFTCIEWLRRRRLEGKQATESMPSSASWSRPEELLLRKEEFENHLRAFESLPSDARKLLQLVFVENLSYRELAARLGVNEGTLRARIHRCRSALRAAAKHRAEPHGDPAVPGVGPRGSGNYP